MSSLPNLGIYAKFSARIDFKGVFFDPETGEIQPGKKAADPVATRIERFALQSAARRILPKSRTAKCLRLRRFDKAEIEVWRAKQHGTAHYGGLQTCASVWACPVCSAKISERRRAELLAAMGIYAESSSAPRIDLETGEIQQEGWGYSAALVERYALQAQARRAMLEAHRLNPAGEKKPHRATRCRRWLGSPSWRSLVVRSGRFLGGAHLNLIIKG